MNRIDIAPRDNWQQAVEKLGFHFHTEDEIPYWTESACYTLTAEDVLKIDKATREVWKMCFAAVDYIIKTKRYDKFYIPDFFVKYLERSWSAGCPALYGRFDFAYKDGILKLLEFNADTPTSVFEAAIVQRNWLHDFDKEKKQYNVVHEQLITTWHKLKYCLNDSPVYFTCMKRIPEDITTTEYMRHCAAKAGLQTEFIFIEDIGWHRAKTMFVDLQLRPIKNVFKLFPYEWLLPSEDGINMVWDKNQANWIEPPWKMILSNKAILAVLWELYPDSEYLLPAYFEPGPLKKYAKKPLISRQGENIELRKGKKVIEQTDDICSSNDFVYQELFELPDFSGNHPLIGSWLIGNEPAGIGIRESNNLITDKNSRFVPHYVEQ